MGEPHAFSLTWHTYGTWLHGHELGSVDRDHDEFGRPFASASALRRKRAQSQMRHPSVTLDEPARVAVQQAIVEVCRFRCWRLLALHVRTTHVHCVVTANAPVEKVLVDFKAYATRRLRRQACVDEADRIWAVHGSTRYLWREDQVAAAVAYTTDRQGTALVPHPYRDPDFDPQSPER